MGRRGKGLIAGVVCTFSLAVAAVANADTYCIATAGCDTAHTKSTLQSALNAVEAGHRAGTVKIGATTLPTNNVTYSAHEPVQIIGAGKPSTTLKETTSGQSALLCEDTHGATVSIKALTITVAAGGQGGFGGLDCSMRAFDVAINTEFAPYAEGIALNGGSATIAHATITASETPASGSPSAAVVARSGAHISVSDSTLLGQIGLWAEGSGGPSSVRAHRLTITTSGSQGDGILAEGGTATVDDSLLLLTGGAIGLDVMQSASHGASLTGRQLTLIGDGSSYGARVTDFTGGGTSSLSVLDSIFRSADGTSSGFVAPLLCYSYAGATQPAGLTIDYDDLALPPSNPCTGGGPSHYVQGTHNLNGINPLFANPAAGDYQLTAASPVRQLDPSPLAPGESPLDLFGRDRIRGGKRDLGAFEYEPPLPAVATLTAGHRSHTRATLHGTVNPRGTATMYYFVYGLSAPRYGHHTTTASAGSGSTSLPVTASLHGLRAGRVYHYELIANSGAYSFSYGGDRTFRTPPYQCVVPRLIGKRLAGARRALRRAHCRLGNVHHSTGSPGRVIAQHPARGRHYRAGHRVSVTIGHA